MTEKMDNLTINIEEYLPLVNRVVSQLNIKESSTIDRDDLISIGVMGLLDASHKYNAQKNASFATYARLRIRGAIIDELRRLGILSRQRMTEVKQYYQKRAELTQQLLQEPTDAQICEYMEISQEELAKIYLNLHYLSVVSLDQTVYSSEEQDISLLETIADQDDSILMKLEHRDQSDELAKAIETLNEREQYILQFYYVEELSLSEMSEILNLSISRISQLHGKIIGKLQEKLKTGKVA